MRRISASGWIFQFTPLREGRRLGFKEAQAHTIKIFQFTPLREGRLPRYAGRIYPRQFQFTPLREGRPHSGFHEKTIAKFQFTPLREGRLQRVNSSIKFFDYFNSRPSARGDVTWQAAFADKLHFNSRPSARGDRAGRYTPAERETFQFTPLREGRHRP